jgi:hypothetical protein
LPLVPHFSCCCCCLMRIYLHLIIRHLSSSTITIPATWRCPKPLPACRILCCCCCCRWWW